MRKLSFSGHESFICKQFWLKKVFDFSLSGKSFNSDTAVVDLGVGKNMVNSLRFWGKSFGIIGDSDVPTYLANYLFGKHGKDIFLENLGTTWLLHYFLLKTNWASIYSIIFNEFRKERIDFTKDQLHGFIKRKCEESHIYSYNKNTIESDITVFVRNYLKPEKRTREIEDSYSGILMELELLKQYQQRDLEGKLIDWYKMEGEDRIELPYQIVLFVIIENYKKQNTITFRELQTGLNSPGTVFALNSDGLYNKLNQITQNYPQIVYTETAGNQILQFKSELSSLDILNDYYSK